MNDIHSNALWPILAVYLSIIPLSIIIGLWMKRYTVNDEVRKYKTISYVLLIQLVISTYLYLRHSC